MKNTGVKKNLKIREKNLKIKNGSSKIYLGISLELWAVWGQFSFRQFLVLACNCSQGL